MADSMYRDARTYCPRCCANLYAVEQALEVAPGVQAPVAVIRCSNPRCEHVVTHPWPGALGWFSDAEKAAMEVLLARGEERKEARR